MATWIAHLRIAENLLKQLPALETAQFAIGSVAPDSGIPDENWEKFTPPPAVTHFKRSRSVHKDIADLEFYRGYLLQVDPQDRARFSFRLGYFFHLITDNLWTIKVGRPTQERFAEDFAADAKFIWEVKRDWYGLDHLYVRAHTECLYWRVFLEAEPQDAELDFLPQEALHNQLKHIKAYYQLDDDEIRDMMSRQKRYLTKTEMDRFVAATSESLAAIYQLLWPKPPELEHMVSALELLHPDRQ
jgi:hypothetical protein